MLAQKTTPSHVPLVVAILATLVSALVLPCCASSRASIHGPRIELYYPAWMSETAAEALLANREHALAFAERFTNCSAGHRVSVIVSETLFRFFGHGLPFEEGIVQLHIPRARLTEWNAHTELLQSYLNCHEETHVVTLLSLGEPCKFLSEGIATYTDAVYSESSLYQLIASELLRTGNLPPLDRLLFPVLRTGSRSLEQLSAYQGGASFTGFIVETYDMDRFCELFDVGWKSAAYLESDLLRLFGLELPELEAAWHEHIRSKTAGRQEIASLIMESMDLLTEAYEIELAIESAWQRGDGLIIGQAPRLEQATVRQRSILARLDASPDTAAAQTTFDNFRSEWVEIQEQLTAWLQAIHAYEEALDLQQAEAAVGSLIPLLRLAVAGYQLAGDTLMAKRSSEWLANLRDASGDDSESAD